MQNINSAAEMKIAIQQVELKHSIQGQIIKEEFFLTIESLKPANIIKNTLSDIATSPYLIDNVLSTTMAMVTGYLSKKIAVGSSDSPFRKAMGAVLQFGVTNIMAQHPEMFKTVGNFLMKMMIHKDKNLNEVQP
jgi:hypothetical protein